MKATKKTLFNRITVLIFVCVSLFTSCTDNKTYRTVLSIKNTLSDSVQVITFLKGNNTNKSFNILKDQVAVIYETSQKKTGEVGEFGVSEIVNNTFDSIKIYDRTSDLVIKFKPDSAYNYRVNPFRKISDFTLYEQIWDVSNTLSSKQAAFSKNLFEATIYTLDIKSENVRKCEIICVSRNE